jgi:hypothetical protein
VKKCISRYIVPPRLLCHIGNVSWLMNHKSNRVRRKCTAVWHWAYTLRYSQNYLNVSTPPTSHHRGTHMLGGIWSTLHLSSRVPGKCKVIQELCPLKPVTTLTYHTSLSFNQLAAHHFTLASKWPLSQISSPAVKSFRGSKTLSPGKLAKTPAEGKWTAE